MSGTGYQFPTQGVPLNQFGLADLRYFNDQQWTDLGNAGHPYCHQCFRHPGEGWGKDCPHGWWITRDRYNLQWHCYWQRFATFALIWLPLCVFWMRISDFYLFLDVMIFAVRFWLIGRKHHKGENAWRWLFSHPELPPGYWEAVDKKNNPWVKRYWL